MVRLSVIALSMLLPVALLCGCIGNKETPHEADSLVSMLFVQSFSSGEYDGETLLLEGSPSLVLYFTDRPARDAGHMTMDFFMNIWDQGADSFEADPPNAVLSILTGDVTHNSTMELRSPEISDSGISYQVQLLSGYLPQTFGASSLLIDSMPEAVVAAAASSGSDTVGVSGEGRAYQSVAQSMAIAIQDAVDNLRNLDDISASAQAVAVGQLLATSDTAYQVVLEKAQDSRTD